MAKFFFRLALAALVDWFTWQISTPEMRMERVHRNMRYQTSRLLENAMPIISEFSTSFSQYSQSFSDLIKYSTMSKTD
jgi:hypothetical protein